MERTTSVFVTVGTDHHPFTRLVDWADRWASAHPGERVLVQYGTSTPPRVADGVEVLPHEAVLRHMRAADVIVAQGGPAGIMDARACGVLPVVLPRDPVHAEHVDDHQIRFARHLAEQGKIVAATSCADLDAIVARVLADPAAFVVTGYDSPTARTAAVIDSALLALTRSRRRRLWAGRQPTRLPVVEIPVQGQAHIPSQQLGSRGGQVSPDRSVSG